MKANFEVNGISQPSGKQTNKHNQSQQKEPAHQFPFIPLNNGRRQRSDFGDQWDQTTLCGCKSLSAVVLKFKKKKEKRGKMTHGGTVTEVTFTDWIPEETAVLSGPHLHFPFFGFLVLSLSLEKFIQESKPPVRRHLKSTLWRDEFHQSCTHRTLSRSDSCQPERLVRRF